MYPSHQAAGQYNDIMAHSLTLGTRQSKGLGEFPPIRSLYNLPS